MNSKKLLLISVVIMLLVILVAQYYYKSKIEDSYLATSSTTKLLKVDDFSEDHIFIYALNGKIDVYVKGSNRESARYIGYHIQHNAKPLDVTIPSSNYDVWNLIGANEFQRKSELKFLQTGKVVTSGEWEMALFEEGATDFVGGVLHGDEITTSIELYVDNKKIDMNDFVEKEVNEVKIITKSELFRDNTTTNGLEKIAGHHKIYTFNKDGLVISQEINFLQDLELKRSYLAMLPILRKSNGEMGEQVTDTVISNYDSNKYDVSEDGFVIPELTFVNADEVTILGKDSGISATVEVTEKSPSEIPSSLLLSNAVNYNKLYFAFNKDGHVVSEGDVWKQKTKYLITTSN